MKIIFMLIVFENVCKLSFQLFSSIDYPSLHQYVVIVAVLDIVNSWHTNLSFKANMSFKGA